MLARKKLQKIRLMELPQNHNVCISWHLFESIPCTLDNYAKRLQERKHLEHPARSSCLRWGRKLNLTEAKEWAKRETIQTRFDLFLTPILLRQYTVQTKKWTVPINIPPQDTSSLPLGSISDYCLLAEQTLENEIDAQSTIPAQFLILELMVGSWFRCWPDWISRSSLRTIWSLSSVWNTTNRKDSRDWMKFRTNSSRWPLRGV